jgi:hypothetical protein
MSVELQPEVLHQVKQAIVGSMSADVGARVQSEEVPCACFHLVRCAPLIRWIDFGVAAQPCFLESRKPGVPACYLSGYSKYQEQHCSPLENSE